MRHFGFLALISIVALLTAVPPAAAQLVRDHEQEGGVRGFHGPRPLGGIKRSFQSDAEARAEFERIVAAVGLSGIADRITLRASAETPNAEAFIGKSGERFIFYNALFMQKVKQRTAEHWSLVSILAHEIGHHLALHTEIEGRWHEFELEADYFSGFVLKRLGATLDQAQTAIRLISPKNASSTHPGLDQRLQVITIGWTDAGAGGSPRGLKGIGSPTPGPQTGVDAEALAKEREALARERERVAFLQKQQEEERQRAEAKRKAEEADPALSVKPGSGRSFRDCPDCPEMLVVPAGSFVMGSPDSEPQREPFQKGSESRVAVSISQPFAVGRFVITRGEFAAFVSATGHSAGNTCHVGIGNRWKDESGRNWMSPDFSQTDRHPVVCMNWNDAKSYVSWLSATTRKNYRLLSDSEREYVTRAGTSSPFWWGLSAATDQANFVSSGQFSQSTVPVDSFRANPWGLFNVHGNIREWMEDCWNETNNGNPGDGSARRTGDCTRRVMRGGSWRHEPNLARSAARIWGRSEARDNAWGFRVARNLD